MNSKLTLLLGFCLIGSTFAATACSDNALANFGQFLQYKGSDKYFWNNCATVGEAYYSQDLSVSGNRIASSLYECAGYSYSTIRQQCETDNSLSSQSQKVRDAYQCLLDFANQYQNVCTTPDTCDTTSNDCNYQVKKQGASTQVLLYATNADYNAYVADLKQGLSSTKCTQINDKCSSLQNQWQAICIKVYQQQCLDSYLNTNFGTDISVKTYQCALTAASKSFSFLVKFSLLALIAFFVF